MLIVGTKILVTLGKTKRNKNSNSTFRERVVLVWTHLYRRSQSYDKSNCKITSTKLYNLFYIVIIILYPKLSIKGIDIII